MIVLYVHIRRAVVIPSEGDAEVGWRAVADQIRPKVSKLAAIMDDAETDVLAYMTFVWTPPGTQGPI